MEFQSPKTIALQSKPNEVKPAEIKNNSFIPTPEEDEPIRTVLIAHFKKEIAELKEKNPNFYDLYLKFLQQGNISTLRRPRHPKIPTNANVYLNGLKKQQKLDLLGNTSLDKYLNYTLQPSLDTSTYIKGLGRMLIKLNIEHSLTDKEIEENYFSKMSEERQAFCYVRINHDGKAETYCDPNPLVTLAKLGKQYKNYKQDPQISFELKRRIEFILNSLKQVYPNKNEEDILDMMYNKGVSYLDRSADIPAFNFNEPPEDKVVVGLINSVLNNPEPRQTKELKPLPEAGLEKFRNLK